MPPPPGTGMHGKPVCTAPGCNNIYRGEQEIKEGIRFHMFPTKGELEKEWLLRLGLEGFQPRTCNRVCGKHFDPESYRPTKSGRLLKPDAVPIPIEEYLKPQSVCLVPGCSARSDRPGRYTLFRFPEPETDLEGFLRWCQFCHWKTEEEALPRTAAVCANHFVPQDIVSEGGLTFLKPGSIPLHFGPTVFTTVRPAPLSLSPDLIQTQPRQSSNRNSSSATSELDKKAFNQWKIGSCRFQCALCGAMVNHTLELAQHLRAIHGLDMEAYIRAHGHSRVRTAYLDCAMCAESVMHDLGAFRRHLLVVHSGVTMEKYFERYVAPVMQQDETQVVQELDLESLQPPRKIQVTTLNLSDLIG